MFIINIFCKVELESTVNIFQDQKDHNYNYYVNIWSTKKTLSIKTAIK